LAGDFVLLIGFVCLRAEARTDEIQVYNARQGVADRGGLGIRTDGASDHRVLKLILSHDLN
jgi:hypothetical protein